MKSNMIHMPMVWVSENDPGCQRKSMTRLVCQEKKKYHYNAAELLVFCQETARHFQHSCTHESNETTIFNRRKAILQQKILDVK